MRQDIQTTREKLAELKRQTETFEADLNAKIFECHRKGHSWGETKAAHIYRNSYTIRGDRPGDPGYGGVDRQFDCHVPAETTHRWQRVCKECGKEEFTSQTNEHVTHTPKF